MFTTHTDDWYEVNAFKLNLEVFTQIIAVLLLVLHRCSACNWLMGNGKPLLDDKLFKRDLPYGTPVISIPLAATSVQMRNRTSPS